VRPHRFGIDVDLVLPHESADGRDFTDAFNRLQRVSHRPVLDAAKLVRVPAADGSPLWVPPFEGVPKDLPKRGGVGPQGRRNTVRHRARRQRGQLFQNTRTRPVELHIIVEDHVDAGEPEHGGAADGAHPGDPHERRRKGVGDLVFDVPRRSTRPLGEHDLLILADVRDGVHGDRITRQKPALERERGDIEAASDKHGRQQKGDQLVVDKPADQRIPAAAWSMVGYVVCVVNVGEPVKVQS
jgi:hypothetical protein